MTPKKVTQVAYVDISISESVKVVNMRLNILLHPMVPIASSYKKK